MKKRTLILLLVAVVVLVGLYFLTTNWSAISERLFPQELTPYDDGTTVVFKYASIEDLYQLSWNWKGRDYTIYRENGTKGDFLSGDGSVTLDQETLKDTLLEPVRDIRASHVLTDVSLSDYELDEPWLQFTITGRPIDAEKGAEVDDVTYTLYVGLLNTVTDSCYATMDFKTVYLLRNKVQNYFGSYDSYTVRESVPEDSIPSYLALTGPDGKKNEFYYAEDEDGTFYTSVFSWYTLQDGVKQPVLLDQLDSVYGVFSDLEWTSVVESHPNDLSVYGLELPRYQLEVRYSYYVEGKDLTGMPTYEQRTDDFILLVGNEMDATHTYAMQKGTNVVHSMATAALDPLVSLDADSIAMHIAVVPEWRTLRKMDVTLSDGTKCTCEIQNTDTGESFFYINGTAVEKETLRGVYLSVFNPALDGIDANANRSKDDAAITVRFQRNRTTFSDMTLYLIPYSSSMYVVDFAGEQKYLVSSRVIDGIEKAVQDALASIS